MLSDFFIFYLLTHNLTKDCEIDLQMKLSFSVIRLIFAVSNLISTYNQPNQMKKSLLSLLLFVLFVPSTLVAQTFVNLTPKPKTMTTATGTLTLPANFVISHSGLDAVMKAEVTRFAEQLNLSTGLNATVKENDETALIKIGLPITNVLTKEGAYNLTVNADGVKISTKNTLGLYYALQTVKKILPANVMAGVKDEKITTYTLPYVTISDEPRFEYRGFMLDVSRHFFTVEEVKRILDVMAYYKMNRFHWHLSDDQGWRVEIKKYPKLTTVGSIAPNRRFTDMKTCTQYWINRPYGPYFYTQEQIREVVAYAKEKHIEIIPEIDMPGHFVAAMAAYPEYSCYPEGSHVIWSDGGISSDVLNVANPEAVQFAKDILSELIELFPYQTIHIGGDECPTSAWEGNALCQQVYREEKMTNYRQLQSRFIKQIGDFVKSKGRELAVWNEAISANGANLNQVTSTKPLVYCWTGPEAAAQKAKELGLKNIYTPWGPYYINRRQGNSPLDPPGAGDGSDDVRKTYNQAIPAATDYGVQGTFWCEHVSDREYLEWLALPRLIAIAEAGWTPQAQRNFADFQKRMTADTVLLNYGNYRYCKYHMLDQEAGEPEKELPLVNTAEKKYYYRLISGGTDASRKDRCIELLADGSPLLTQYADKGAKVGTLWTNVQTTANATNYEAQWWSLEEDPANKGKFALVCKAQPNGSVKATPTNTSTAGRWIYDNTTKHYDFVLGEKAYGNIGNNHYYSIAANGQHMNSSMGGQGLAVNVYNDPLSGNGGCWQFAPMENYTPGTPEAPITFTPLAQGKTYVITNAVEGYQATTLADDNKSPRLAHSTDAFSGNVWTATVAGEAQTNGTQLVRLQNVATGRFISSLNNYVGREGRPVVMDATGNDLTLKYEPATKEFRLLVDGKSVFPLPNGKVNAGSNVDANATYDAPRLQGAAWTIQEVKVATLNCVDDLGNNLGTFKRGINVTTTELTEALCPTFENMTFQKVEAKAENEYTVSYKRAAFNLTIQKVDTKGALIENKKVAVPVGQEYTFQTPTVQYYTFESCATPDGTKLTLTKDELITVVYSTEAYSGVKQVGEAVKEIKAGNSYLLFDASDANNNARQGYRRILANNKQVNRYAAGTQEMDPSATWTLVEKGENKYQVKNEYYSLFIPQLQAGKETKASATGDTFTFSLNADGETWTIKGSNNQCWDGNENGLMVGWNAPGHPIKAFQYFVQPYFKAQVTCVNEEGQTLQQSETLDKAGATWTLVTPTIEGYDLVSVTGNEDYEGQLDRNLDITVTYKKINTGIETVETSTANVRQGIYDLQGRKLNRIPQPGIYIINGKKVLVK